MFQLRDYQQQAADLICEGIDDGWRPVIQCATGGGKTVIMAEVIRRRLHLGRQVVIVHRDSIARQWATTISKHCNVAVGIEMGGERARKSDKVVIASVHTVGRDGGKRLPRDVHTKVYDEMHHASLTNVTYKTCRDTQPDAAVCGCTATLRRTDGASLRHMFDRVVADINIRWLIEHGHLVDMLGEAVDTDVDLSGVRSTSADFIASDLAKVVETDDRHQLAVNHHLHHHRDRQFLAFVSSVRGAHRLAGTYRSSGLLVEAVDASTPPEERDRILSAYKRGRMHGIINVAVYTEGTDLPSCSEIQLLRPTKSSLLMTQMVGRGLRTWSADKRWEGADIGLSPEKHDCILTDFVDIAGKHTLVHPPSLIGLEYAVKDRPLVRSLAEQGIPPEDPFVSLPLTEYEQFNPFAGVSLTELYLSWEKTDDGWQLTTPDSEVYRVTGTTLLIDDRTVAEYTDILDTFTKADDMLAEQYNETPPTPYNIMQYRALKPFGMTNIDAPADETRAARIAAQDAQEEAIMAVMRMPEGADWREAMVKALAITSSERSARGIVYDL